MYVNICEESVVYQVVRCKATAGTGESIELRDRYGGSSISLTVDEARMVAEVYIEHYGVPEEGGL